MTRHTTFRTVARIAIVAAALFPGRPAAAQDRLPPIPAAKMTDAQKKAVEEFKAARGVDVSGPFVVLLRSPDLMNRVRALGDYLRYKSVLPPQLSEFVIILAARQMSQSYEWSTHQPLALKAGLKPDIAQAIADGRRPEGMNEEQTLLYELCMELHHNKTVSDGTYAKAVAKFGEQGVIDAVGITGYYTLLGYVLNTSRTAADPGTPTLAPLIR